MCSPPHPFGTQSVAAVVSHCGLRSIEVLVSLVGAPELWGNKTSAAFEPLIDACYECLHAVISNGRAAKNDAFMEVRRAIKLRAPARRCFRLRNTGGSKPQRSSLTLARMLEALMAPIDFS
jgi:hypothetical protein